MDLFDQVQHVIATTLKVTPDKISRETSDKDLASWDSIAHVKLMMGLEQTFDVVLEVEEFAQLTSVPALLEYQTGQGKA